MDDPKEYAEDRCSLRDTRLSLDLETLCHVVTTEVPLRLSNQAQLHHCRLRRTWPTVTGSTKYYVPLLHARLMVEAFNHKMTFRRR